MNKSNRGSIWTLDDFVQEYQAEDIRIDAFYLKQVLWDNSSMKNKVVINEDSIIDKYMNELESTKKVIELSTPEYYKYRYNPKLLSYDIYGTTELWFLILIANELYTISEFDLKKIIVFDPTIITKLNHMLDLDSEFLDTNAMEVKTDIDKDN